MSRLPTFGFLFALSCTVLAPWSARAGGAPPQLYNKSITLNWVEARTNKFPNGSVRHPVVHSNYGIYISSTGRVFSQIGRYSQPPRGTPSMQTGSSVGPDGTVIKTSNSRYGRALSFAGRSIHTVWKYESGARRITVNFADDFGSCTAEIIYGKEDGVPGIVQRGMSTQLHMLVSINISSPICAIKNGNIFGGRE
jgi:hypothetical protein